MSLDAPVVAESGMSGRRVAKNTLIYLLGQCLTWTVSIVAITIVPRRLGEAGMGQITLATVPIATVVQFLSLSIEMYLTTEVGRDRREAERLVRAVLGLRLALVPVFWAAVLIVLAATGATRAIWTLGIVSALGSMVAFTLGPLNNVQIGMEDARRVTILSTFATSNQLAAVPFLRLGPISVVAATTLFQAIASAIQVRWMRCLVSLRPVFVRSEWEHIIRGGLPFLANNIVISLYGFTTVFLLKHFAGEADVGVYSQSQRIFGTFFFIPTAISAALLPSLSRMAAGDAREFRAMQSRILCLIVTLGLPVACGAFVLAQPLCHLLYGRKAFGGVPAALQVAALNVIPVYITSTMYQFLTAQRKNAVWSVFLMITVLINGIGCFVLIPLCRRLFDNPAMGAQAACLIAEVISVPFALFLLRSNPFGAEMVGRLIRAFAAAALMVIVMLATRRAFIVVPAVLGMVTFVVAGWFLRILGEEDQQRLVELVKRRLRRGAE